MAGQTQIVKSKPPVRREPEPVNTSTPSGRKTLPW